MAKNREGSINLFGPVQAKTEDGIVAHADGIAVEYDENNKPSKTLEEFIKDINKTIEEGNLGGTVTGEDSFVTVNNLPDIMVQLPGTPTPTGESVYIESLYFNTELSVEEVKQIILDYCENNNLYNENGSASFYYIEHASDNTKQLRVRVLSGGGICIADNKGPSAYTYYWCDETFANNNMGNYNITKVGWQDFTNPLVITDYVKALYEPMDLFFITPPSEGLNPAIKEEKIYRLFKKEAPKWVGTTIPNTGKVDGFYFNISLSIEEVEKIINTLDFSNGASDHEYQAMWFNTGMTSDDIKIEKYEDGAMRITSASGSNTYWCNQNYKDNYNTNIQNTGWGAGATSWNDEGYVRLSYEFYSTMYGNPVGDQNDKLSGLISLTPFEYVEGKEALDSYYRFKNNSWFKVLDEPDIMDVDKLPEGNGTVVPNTGLVEKVYVNTNLSNEEIEAIIDKLCPVNEENDEITYTLLQRDDNEIYCSISIGAECWYNDDNILVTGKYIGAYFERYDDTKGWITELAGFLWCNNIIADDEGVTPGWQEFTNPIEINTEVQDRWDEDEEPIFGLANDELTNLFSTTPFTKVGGDPNKIYRVKPKPVENLPVPSNGQVGKVYFNTKLSAEEVNEILNGLDYVMGVLSAPAVAIATNADMSKGLVIMAYPADTDYAILTGDGTLIYVYSLISNDTRGWLLPDVDLNIDNMLEIIAPQVGMTIQNDKLKNLISITPFEEPKEEPEYFRKKGAKWIKVLEDTPIIDVDTLPPATIDTSTVVPSAGQVGKIYFNTKLSVEEVNEILSSLNYIEGILSAPSYAVATTADMQQGLVIISGVLDDGNTMYAILTGDGKYIYQYLPGDSYTPLGFQYSEIDLNIDNMLSVLAPQVGMTIQNDKLKNLISTTPFESPNTDIQLDKLYRTPIQTQKGWAGTAVPNSGYVDKVYLNTELSIEEIKSLLEQLNYFGTGNNSGIYFAFLTSNKGSIICAKQNEIYTIQEFSLSDETTLYWISEDFETYSAGWQTFDNPFVLETEVLTEEMGITMGAQNSLLHSLVSTTPFVSSDGGLKGYKYNQLVNGEWKELGSGEPPKDLPVIVKYSGDIQSIKMTDEEWDKLYNSSNAYIIINGQGFKVCLHKKLVYENTLIFHGYLPYEISIVITKTENGYDYERNIVTHVDRIDSLGIDKDAQLLKLYYTWDGASEEVSIPIDTETLNDANNLTTSKAVRNYIAEYMTTNYGDGDTEKF